MNSEKVIPERKDVLTLGNQVAAVDLVISIETGTPLISNIDEKGGVMTRVVSTDFAQELFPLKENN